MSYKESAQPLKQLKQVVSPSNLGIKGVFEQFPVLLDFGALVHPKAAPPWPAAKPEPPVPGTGSGLREQSSGNPALRRGGTCRRRPSRHPARRGLRPCHNGNKSPSAFPPVTAGVIKQPTNNAHVRVRELGSND